jgi:protein gp37
MGHKIGWLNIPGYIPQTWNPIIGCDKISEGCEHCYAERMANRLASNPKTKDNYSNVISKGKWNGLATVCYDQVGKPLEWIKPRSIFVCSMGDLFHESVSFFEINSVFGTMSDCDQHIFIIITKRPERMAAFWKWKKQNCMDVTWCPKPNVWIGVTAENQQRANERIPVLLSIPAAKRIVSIEPMLGPIGMQSFDDNGSYNFLTGNVFSAGMNEPCVSTKLDWVIVGGETGPRAREIDIAWVNSIEIQCSKANVPFFMKSFGSKQKELDIVITNDYRQFPKL